MSRPANRFQYALARLTNTAARTIPTEFRLRCRCGAEVTGERKPGWIQSSCPECGELHFILPVNVYPTTKRVPSLVLDGSFFRRLKVVLVELVTGGPQTTTTESIPVSRPEDYAPPPRTADPRGRAAKAGGWSLLPWFRLPKVSLPRIDPIALFRRVVTPFRVVGLSVLVIAVATVWWIIQQNRIEDARAAWRNAMDGAERALAGADLSALREELQTATAAAVVLARRDDDVRDAENLLRQTEAVLSLSSVDLFSEVLRLADARPAQRVTDVPQASRLLAGEWFIFDCRVRSGRGDRGIVELELPVHLPELSTTVAIQSDWLRQAQQERGEGALLIAARVDRVELSTSASEGLIIFLQSDSATLMTSEQHVDALGLTVVPETIRELLTWQKEFVRAHERPPADEPGDAIADAT